MANHSPKPPKKSLEDLISSAESGANPAFKGIIDAQRGAFRRFIKNNQYLLAIEGKSVYKQLKEIEAKYDFKISDQTYSDLKRQRKLNWGMIVFSVISHYWGIPLGKMLDSDLAEEAKNRQEQTKVA